jgi:hypothetical protein
MLITFYLLSIVFIRRILGDDQQIEQVPDDNFIPTIITEYPQPAYVQTKYSTDTDEYTLKESFVFSIRTSQDISQATTILAGFVALNVYFIVDIQVCSN